MNDKSSKVTEQKGRKPADKLSDEIYVNQAELVIKTLLKKNKLVSTSQLRNILAMVMDIYNQVVNEKEKNLNDDIVSQIQYLKIKIIYNAGKDDLVKEFVKLSRLDKYIDQIGDIRKNYILFTRYVEALVAYMKYYESNI